MSANNFIIFFGGKEGTSPLVRLLNNFDQLSIVHHVDGKGWEPFDRHNCGPMPLASLQKCFEHIFGNHPIDMDDLNNIYTQTAKNPLEKIDSSKTVGFKMRFQLAKQSSPKIARIPGIRKVVNPILRKRHQDAFNEFMVGFLQKYNIVPFIAVRQDVFRWALSKYHGDGTGKHGHLQFKVAGGSVNLDDLPKINVDCSRLDKIIADCEGVIERKRTLVRMLESNNIKVHPLLYEKFCTDKLGYFVEMFSKINLEISNNDIETAINKGSYFKKVHADDISSFVENHEEVTEKLGHRFVEWA